MKHTISRMLFAYWDGLRAERAAPDRNAVRPGDMRHILPDTFLLAADDRVGPVFRLAGSRCCALFGRELRDRTFASLWDATDHPAAERLVRTVLDDTVGIVAGVIATSEAGATVGLEVVMLPLRHNGKTNSRVLGAISPAAVPSWAGLVPITGLETQVVRIIQAGSRATSPSPPPDPVARRRNLFVVHEGGRA